MLERVWRKGNPPAVLVGLPWCNYNVEHYGDLFKKFNIELLYYSAIPPLSRYLVQTIIQKYICTPTFIAALYTIAKTWKQPKYTINRRLD